MNKYYRAIDAEDEDDKDSMHQPSVVEDEDISLERDETMVREHEEDEELLRIKFEEERRL